MAQVTVRKNNKVLNIEDTRLESYLLQGFDQIDKDGLVITKATGGKNVSLAKYNKVLDELDQLKKENAALKGKIAKQEKEAKK